MTAGELGVFRGGKCENISGKKKVCCRASESDVDRDFWGMGFRLSPALVILSCFSRLLVFGIFIPWLALGQVKDYVAVFYSDH